LSEVDVQAGLAWSRQLPPGAARDEAHQQVFNEWTRRDPTAVSQELQTMPPSQERDNAVRSFALILVRENPLDAMTWAGSITDATHRLDTQIEAARRWTEVAPADAAAWIASHLPAAAQAQVLRSAAR
jgi:hypothetical protein